MSFLVDGILESMGNAMIDAGANCLKGGTFIWNGCNRISISYLKMNPQGLSGGWSMVTGSIYSHSLGIGGALTVMYFLMGWARDSIDVRSTFSFDGIFKLFIRLVLTTSLIANSMALVTGITECATAVVSTVGMELPEEQDSDVFDSFKSQLAEDKASGGTVLSSGLVGMVAGFFGAAIIIVCGVQILLTVFSRLFKMYLCIPFAPAAFAGFAGGSSFNQTGIAWLRTFIGYALEAVVIALAIAISYGLTKDAAAFNTTGEASVIGIMLTVCGYCVPMLACSSSAKLADNTVRRCLGL